QGGYGGERKLRQLLWPELVGCASGCVAGLRCDEGLGLRSEFVELGFVHDTDCRGFDSIGCGTIHTTRPLAEKRAGGEAMSPAFSVSALFSLEAVYVLTGVVLLIFAALTLLDRINPKRF